MSFKFTEEHRKTMAVEITVGDRTMLIERTVHSSSFTTTLVDHSAKIGDNLCTGAVSREDIEQLISNLKRLID